jgi:hypothetical protein
MPWPFKREESDATEAFAKELFAVHEDWERRIDSAAQDDRTRALLLSGTAGATVAFGAHAAMLREEVAGAGGAGGSSDTVGRFARALDNRRAIEAAYRVAVWALVSEFASNVWANDHEQEIGKCEIVFGFENLFEETAVAYGQPAPSGATQDQEMQRMFDLLEAALYAMISAALDEPVEPGDDAIDERMETWVEQFEAGIDAGAERMEELAP